MESGPPSADDSDGEAAGAARHAPRGCRAWRNAASLALALAFAACSDAGETAGGGGHGGAGRSERAVPVVVTSLQPREFVDTIEALGTARANESVVITAQVTETVSEVRFEDGRVVAADDVIVELTSREESAQLAEARANFDEAQRQYRRTAELAAQGSASKALVDARRAARDAARARLNELQARMRDRLVRAPFGGVLGLREVSPGTLVQPGDRITTLDDIDRIKLDFSVPERFLSVLGVGLPIRAVAAAWPEHAFEGTVSAIDTRVDPRTRAVQVRAELPNPEHRLRPGMLLTVELSANRRTALAVPEQALVPVGTSQFVFVLSGEDHVRRVELTTGRRRAGMVEVLSGLEQGDTVVLEGGNQLRPGGLVRVVPSDAPAVAGTASGGGGS